MKVFFRDLLKAKIRLTDNWVLTPDFIHGTENLYLWHRHLEIYKGISELFVGSYYPKKPPLMDTRLAGYKVEYSPDNRFGRFYFIVKKV